MARTRIDLPTQLPETIQRPLYAGVGVTDRVVELLGGGVPVGRIRATF